MAGRRTVRLERLEPARPGSAADLRERQQDLPPGHPSSPEARARAADGPERAYWSQVPRFEQMWADHERRWPGAARDEQVDRARPGDQPGSWRSGSRYLSPGDNGIADQVIAELRRPEQAATAQLRQVERESPFGGRLVGLEHRIKGEDRLKEKIAERLEDKAGSTMADASARISDAVRYTFCLGRDEYVPGYADVCRRLESAGYRMFYAKNSWLTDPQYKGVNTRWEAPGGGRFELQFHTAESFHAKERLTHDAYGRLRTPETDWQELGELETYQRTVSAAVPAPPDVSVIEDHEDELR